MYAHPGVLGKIGVGQHRCPLALRVVGLQTVQAPLRLGRPLLTHIEQVEVVVSLVHARIGRIMVCQAAQVLLAEP